MYFEETMSRDYLQGLVQMKKQADHARHVSEIVKDIMQKIGAVAATSASCYLYEMPNLVGIQENLLGEATNAYRGAQGILTRVHTVQMPASHMSQQEMRMIQQQQQARHLQQLQLPFPPILTPLPITMDDIVEALKLKCPGCDVAHQESWVDTAPGIRVLKNGIYISWE